MKIEDITPVEFFCGVGACPSVFRTDQDTLLLVGRALSLSEIQQLIPGRISSHEGVVEVPIGLVKALSE